MEIREKISILMDAIADEKNINAQNLNAREIAFRLDPDIFEITLFYFDGPDKRLCKKRNVHLIQLPKGSLERKIFKLKYYLKKEFDIFFYIRNDWGDLLYLMMRKLFNDRKPTVYLVENLVPYPFDNAPPLYNWISKKVAQKSDYVVSII